MKMRLWARLAMAGLGLAVCVVVLILAACQAPQEHASVDANAFKAPIAQKGEEVWIMPTGPAVSTAPATAAGGLRDGGAGGRVDAPGLFDGDLSTMAMDGTSYGGGPGGPARSTAGMGGLGGGVGGGGGRGGRAGGGGMGGPGAAPAAGGARGGGGGRGRGSATPPPAQPTAVEMDGMPLPGSPVLAARQADGKLIIVPLKHTDVDANLTGYIASVGVTQQFTNPYAEKIEAVYVFPLPENAGISEFVMTIGERHIRGIIRERQEAERIYQEARAQGYVASLMTQERPNIFTQKVANIEPGKSIDISIRYFHTLSYVDGWFEWVFPMVVGPRYNPAGSTNGVGAVPVGAAGASGQRTEVQYVRPEDRSGHDIGLKVVLNAGVEIEDLASVNHKIGVRRISSTVNQVTLAQDDKLPNKDFVLRYKVAGDKVKTGMFVQKDKEGNGGWFTLMLVPPEDLKSLPRRGVEMVFVMDTSGSMNGQPIEQSKKAVSVALSKMAAGDTFQVINFNNSTGQLSAAPLAVTESNVARAQQYVAAMTGNGGTEMMGGVNAALGFAPDPNRTRVVTFMTDGYIGNEMQVLKAIHAQLADARIFSFGVGTSVNRYLMESMARLGNGHAAFLSINEPAEPVMDKYFERISHPALANVKVAFTGMKVSEVYPQRVPELFVGRPIILTGRFTGSPSGEVTIRGRAGEKDMSYSLSAAASGAAEENAAISTVWARAKVADLHDESIYEGRDVTADVKSTALTYGIMSEFTSFVAVDSAQRTGSDPAKTVQVPVPVPQGVRYETTVKE